MSSLKILKISTDQLHKEVEATTLNKRILSPAFSLSDYKNLTQKNFYIHQAIEENILTSFQSIKIDELQDFFVLKSNWLKKDLEELGIIPNDQLFLSAPTFKTPSNLLGALYVIEGSMLGGRMIHKALKGNHNLSTVSSFYFFESYGPDLGTKWRTFQSLAEKHITNIEEAVESAKDTFRFYKTVFNAQ